MRQFVTRSDGGRGEGHLSRRVLRQHDVEGADRHTHAEVVRRLFRFPVEQSNRP